MTETTSTNEAIEHIMQICESQADLEQSDGNDLCRLTCMAIKQRIMEYQRSLGYEHVKF